MKQTGLDVWGLKDCIYPLSPSVPEYYAETMEPIIKLLYMEAVDPRNLSFSQSI